MAQRDITSASKELASIKQRPSSLKFQTSLSQPAPSNPAKLPKSTTRRHLTLPEPLNKNYSQSPAELYILSRSQMFAESSEVQAISPSTPSTASSITRTNVSSIQSPMGHSERMQQWQQKQANEICKKHKYRYAYGPRPTSWGLPFSSPTCFTPCSPTHTAVLSRKNN